MDFLDPKKRRAQSIRLMIGYVLVAIAILLGTVVALDLAYGYTLNKGKIVQNGLVFVSSHPGGSNIFLNNTLTATTNSRLTLAAGTYTMDLQRTGYRTWHREITVQGDSVERFDYPFMFPTNLVTSNLQTLSSAPIQTLQSPNRRWLLTEVKSGGSFDLYDINNPKSVVQTAISLPANVLAAAQTSASQSLKIVSWSNDNDHVLLQHFYDNTSEFIMLDTQSPSKSINLNKTLGVTPSQLTLQNGAYDHYFVYDAASQVLSTASLSSPKPIALLSNVLAYKTYGTNVVLYATSQGAPAGQTAIMLFQNNQNYHIRNVSQSSTYLLNLTQYSGSWYIVGGSSADSRVYVYQNPLEILTAQSDAVLVPIAVLNVTNPNYVSFSASAQFIMAENANSFAVYDIQYNQNYVYKVNAPMDAPQPNANWMDGDRIDYISNGKLVVFDYDDTNVQTLMPANPLFMPDFDPGYNYVYTLASQAASGKTPAATVLTDTPTLTPADNGVPAAMSTTKSSS